MTREAPIPELAPAAPAAREFPFDREHFRIISERVYNFSGIRLPEAKREMVYARLARRLRALGIASFDAYVRYLELEPAEWEHCTNALTTNVTSFFREEHHFRTLAAHAQAHARPGARYRVWSAGCSTGEEPYSIAMTLLNRFPPGSGWQLSVLATDISTRALAHARNALYCEQRAGELPAELARLFARRERRPANPFEPSVRLVPELQRVVELRYLNLTSAAPVRLGRFDLVFCRNVMIYFQPATRRRVVDMLLQHLEPDGYLFLGHAESLIGLSDRVRCVGPTIYAPCDGAKSKPPATT